MKGETFSAGRNKMTIYYDRGKVAGKDKHLETIVSGSGGGGGTYPGTSTTAPINMKITSRTVIHDKIYLQKEDGKERAVELTDWDVACHEGNDMLVTWIIPDGKERGDYVAIKNITTDSELFNDAAVKNVANQHFIKITLLRWVIAIVVMIILYNAAGGSLGTLWVAAFVAYEIYIYTKNKQATTIVKKYLKELLDSQM